MVFPKMFERVLMKRFITPTLFVLIMLISGIINAAETVRVGTLQFGTVNWELDTARHYGLDTEQDIRIEVMSYANKQAVHIIFQSKEVDMIVTDWVWVSRKRAEGDDFSFIPYSSSLGAVMMPPNSNIESLSDLRDLRLGVAGGAHDKSWLLLQAWGNKEHNFKLSDSVDVNYAAPPLLNGQIERNNLDAVLNFWHYCARLEAINYHPLVKMSDVMKDLGIDPIPMVGYTFRGDWAKQHNGLVVRFNNAIRNARELLRNDNEAWNRLRPMMRAENEATFIALRDRYREGIPSQWGETDRKSAVQLMAILSEIGGSEAVGNSTQLMPGTFWSKGYF